MICTHTFGKDKYQHNLTVKWQINKCYIITNYEIGDVNNSFHTKGGCYFITHSGRARRITHYSIKLSIKKTYIQF